MSMKTPIEVHNGVPLGVPPFWTGGVVKGITHKGREVAELWLHKDGGVEVVRLEDGCYIVLPTQTVALKWIAGHIKETEDA